MKVNDNISIKEEFVINGVTYSQKRHGKIMELKDNKALVYIANFGTAGLEWVDVGTLQLEKN